VLERQLALRETLVRQGRIRHEHLFFHANGRPIRELGEVYGRWRRTLKRLAIRYRKPYAARHSSAGSPEADVRAIRRAMRAPAFASGAATKSARQRVGNRATDWAMDGARKSGIANPDRNLRWRSGRDSNTDPVTLRAPSIPVNPRICQ
jgi:hypothetical protein